MHTHAHKKHVHAWIWTNNTENVFITVIHAYEYTGMHTPMHTHYNQSIMIRLQYSLFINIFPEVTVFLQCCLTFELLVWPIPDSPHTFLKWYEHTVFQIEFSTQIIESSFSSTRTGSGPLCDVLNVKYMKILGVGSRLQHWCAVGLTL